MTNIVLDENGQPWRVSEASGGIKMRRIDPATGKAIRG